MTLRAAVSIGFFAVFGTTVSGCRDELLKADTDGGSGTVCAADAQVGPDASPNLGAIISWVVGALGDGGVAGLIDNLRGLGDGGAAGLIDNLQRMVDGGIPVNLSNPICPADVRTGTCAVSDAGLISEFCALSDLSGICTCLLGRWLCPAAADAATPGPAQCPANAVNSARCFNPGAICVGGPGAACVCMVGTYACVM